MGVTVIHMLCAIEWNSRKLKIDRSMRIQSIYKPFIFTCIFLFSGVLLRAQSQADLDTAIFSVVENPPEYPGGIKEFVKYVQERLTVEPEEDVHVNKKVYVQFIIDKSGQVQDAGILQGVSKEIDKEILQVFEQSPRWIPGRQRGVAVYVKSSVAIPLIKK